MPPDSPAVVRSDVAGDTFRSGLATLAETGTGTAPDWLQPIRAGALRRLPRLALPDRKTERWKYTPTRALYAAAWQAPVAEQAAAASPADSMLGRAHASIVNGHCAALQTPPAGVEISAFSNLTSSQQALVQDLLDRRGYDHYAFADVNSALLQDGVFVHVHRAADAAAPPPTVIVSSTLIGTGQFCVQPRVLVLVDPGASAHLVDISHSQGTAGAWSNALTEIQLGHGAALEHTRLRLDSPDVNSVAAYEVRLGRDARYRHACMLTGGALCRTDLTIAASAPGSEVNIDGMLAAVGRDHIDLHLDLEHASTQGTSHTRINSLARQRARIVFNGRIHIHRHARGTSAHLQNRNLCLSADAQINTKPELEIYNDDVQCSHGATVGSLDAGALFYLRSRGLDQDSARQLLIAAFTDERLDAINDPDLRDEARSALHDYLAAADTQAGRS